MYCTGELVYHMLTKEMPFEGSVGLTNYVLSPDIFPTFTLRSRGVSDAAIDFVKVAMRPIPETRPTVRQALDHAWIKPRTSNVHFLAE
jgi:serine/threonine protein kinase